MPHQKKDHEHMQTQMPAEAIKHDEISLLNLLQVIADNLRLLILAPLAVGLLALAASFAIKPTFTATTRFLPPQQQQSAAASMLQSLGALGGLAGAATGLKNPTDQFISFLKSRTVGDALVERFQLMKRYEKTFRQDALKTLEDKSSISSGKDNIIKVSVDDPDPKIAADLANAYAQELEKLLGRLAVTEAQQRRVFFEQQLASTKDALIKAEKNLAASGVSASALNATPQTALEGPARLRAQITAQEVRIASMRSYVTESAPELRQALAELAAVRAQLRKAEQAQPTGGTADAYIEKFREFKYQETLFELFAKQFEIARIDESREGATIQIIDPATPPERKSKPAKGLIAIAAALAAGIIVVLFIFIRHSIFIAHQNPESARKLKNIRTAFARSLGRVNF